jgi:hypothetical protein
MGEKRGVYRFWVGRPEGKRTLGRPRLGWECNVEKDLKGLAWEEWPVLVLLRIRTGDELL